MTEFREISGGEGSLVRVSIGGYAVPLPAKGSDPPYTHDTFRNSGLACQLRFLMVRSGHWEA